MIACSICRAVPWRVPREGSRCGTCGSPLPDQLSHWRENHVQRAVANFVRDMIAAPNGTSYLEIAARYALPADFVTDQLAFELGYIVWRETSGWVLTPAGEILVAQL